MARSKVGAVQFDELVKWIIGIVVMLTLFTFYLKLSGNLNNLIESLKSIFRF